MPLKTPSSCCVLMQAVTYSAGPIQFCFRQACRFNSEWLLIFHFSQLWLIASNIHLLVADGKFCMNGCAKATHFPDTCYLQVTTGLEWWTDIFCTKLLCYPTGLTPVGLQKTDFSCFWPTQWFQITWVANAQLRYCLALLNRFSIGLALQYSFTRLQTSPLVTSFTTHLKSGSLHLKRPQLLL